MRHILNFSNYRTILTMTVTDYNYSPSFSKSLKKKKKKFVKADRLLWHFKNSYFLGCKMIFYFASPILPTQLSLCILLSLQRSSSVIHVCEQMLHIFLLSVATTLEPPEHWTEYVHLKALSTSLQLSHKSLHFPPKGGSERSIMKIYQDISLLDKGFQVC